MPGVETFSFLEPLELSILCLTPLSTDSVIAVQKETCTDSSNLTNQGATFIIYTGSTQLLVLAPAKCSLR